MRSRISPFRITNGRHFKLKETTPATPQHRLKEEANDLLARGLSVAHQQEKLYAQGTWAVLIFQAMDAAGKDSVIKHVMSGVNPGDARSRRSSAVVRGAGARLSLADHDRLPAHGQIGVFNRSSTRKCSSCGCAEILGAQRLPKPSSRSASGTSASRISPASNGISSATASSS
jgi:polyphosphate kinase 2 (PPK2 family)